MAKIEVVITGKISKKLTKTLKDLFNKTVTLADLLSKYGIILQLGPSYLRATINFKNSDRKAAWELYIELLTRVTTQALPAEDGDEKTALDSIYSLFPTTREILKKYGDSAINFSKIAIPVLNQKIRPFTAKWHRLYLADCFSEPSTRNEFRKDLENLQEELEKYNKLLAKIAGVEDLTSLEGSSTKMKPS